MTTLNRGALLLGSVALVCSAQQALLGQGPYRWWRTGQTLSARSIVTVSANGDNNSQTFNAGPTSSGFVASLAEAGVDEPAFGGQGGGGGDSGFNGRPLRSTVLMASTAFPSLAMTARRAISIPARGASPATTAKQRPAALHSASTRPTPTSTWPSPTPGFTTSGGTSRFRPPVAVGAAAEAQAALSATRWPPNTFPAAAAAPADAARPPAGASSPRK